MTPTVAMFAAIVGLGLVVEAVAGFGATVVTVALASQLLPIADVLAAFVPVNFVLSAYLVARHYKDVDVRVLLRRLVPATAAGVAVGLLLLNGSGADWLRIAFAIFLLALATASLWSMRTNSAPALLPLRAPQAHAALFVAGVIHGLFACGGPLVVYVAERELPEKSRFRATMSALWLIFHVVLLVSYRAAGTLTSASMKTSGVLAVVLLVSIPIGEWVHKRISQERFRVGVYVLLGIAGAVQLYRALFA